jgi:hypothetical protein
MKKTLSYICFVFLLCMGFNKAIIAQTIDQTSVEVLPSTLNDNALSYGQTIDLRFNIYFDFNECGEEMSLKVTVPSRLNTSQISLEFSDVFDPSIVGQVDNTDGTRTLDILLQPGPDFTSSSIFTTTLFEIKNVVMPPSGCGQEAVLIKATLTTLTPSSEGPCATSNAQRLMNIVATDETLSLDLRFRDQQTNIAYDNAIDPFSATLKINKDRYSLSLQTKFDLRIDIGNALMTVREITFVDDNSQYNRAKVVFVQNGSIITFSTQNLNGQAWSVLSYRIYFDLNCTNPGSQEAIAVEVKATPFLSCTQQAGTALTINRNYNYTCFDDTDRLAKPTINYTPVRICSNTCQPSYMYLEIDNTFNSSALSAFDYVIDINEDILLSYFGAVSPVGGYSINQNASSISYKLCGSGLWINSSYANLSWPCTDKVDKIKISYVNFPAGASADIVLLYRYDNKDCAANPIQASSNPMTSYFVINETTLPSKNIVYSKITCNIGSLYDRIETFPNSQNFSSFSRLKSQQEYYIKIQLQLTNGTLNDYTCTYQLNPNMTWANQDVSFLIANYNYNDISQYKNAASARLDFPTELGSMTYAIVGDKLTVQHINLANNCRACDNAGEKSFFVLVKVKPSPFALAGNFQNVFLNCQSNISCYTSTFQIQATAAASTELYIDCENLTKVRSSNIRLKQNFNYNFVCVNKGNGFLKDIVAIFAMPDVNAKLTFSNINSQTEYKITRDCNPSPENQIKAYQVDPLGNIVGQPVPLTVDYLSKAEICSIDFDMSTETSSCNGPGGSVQWAANGCNQNTVKFMRFRTLPGFVLGPYNQLLIKAPFITPVGVAFGRKAIQSFVARATYVDANQIITKTNFMRSNSLALTLATRSSCEPPIFECKDCVTSFSPIPEEKYLLSAWVKEEYANQYPETYKNSAIRLTFNEGEFKLPDMKAQGPIIDGWQRIEAEFVVPQGAYDIEVKLLNLNALGGGNVYFDDVRIHPFRSNMKSFVYNPSTQKLTAELDENNYATLYEYDDEGILIRVKKETERGVMTIKETRMNQSKITGGQ